MVMDEMEIYVPDTLDTALREAAMKGFGHCNGSVSLAAGGAITQRVAREEAACRDADRAILALDAARAPRGLSRHLGAVDLAGGRMLDVSILDELSMAGRALKNLDAYGKSAPKAVGM